MKLTESDFNANLLPALQTLHTKLTRDEIEFDSAKETLIEYVKRWTLNPAIRADLVNEIRKQTQNSNELISKVEEILMIFGGVQALGAVAEDKMKHEHIDALLKKISESITQLGGSESLDTPNNRAIVEQIKTFAEGLEDSLGENNWTAFVNSIAAIITSIAGLMRNTGNEVISADLYTIAEKATREEKGISEVSTTQGPGNEQEDLRIRMVAKAKKRFGSEADDLDIEAAIYWLASDNHTGQASALYGILSTSKFEPGPSHNSVEDEGEMATEIYDMLMQEFAREIK